MKPYMKQGEIALLVGASRQSVALELKKRGVERTRFGYLTTDVIKALRLEEYFREEGEKDGDQTDDQC